MKVIIDSWAWISKSDVPPTQIEALRKALTLTPRKVGDHPGEAPAPIRLYSENAASFGMPRQFFMARRKPAHEVEYQTTLGDKSTWPCDLKFHGELRPEQARGKVEVSGLLKAGHLGGLVRAVPGWGKCLRPDTLVLTYEGRLVRVDALKVGDQLMGPDSKPRTVLASNPGFGPMYRITPTIGDPWECNDAHILTLVDTRTDEVRDISLQEYLQLSASWKHRLKQFSPAQGVQFPVASPLPLDPYFLGVWYGDGTKALNGVAISKPDAEIELLCQQTAARFGLRVRTERQGGCPTYHFAAERGSPNPLLNLLREVFGEGESLPHAYLTASWEDRKAFLAGWLDSDGYQNNGCYEIVHKRRAWADGIAFLARSLGIRATVREKKVNGESYWRVKLAGDFHPLASMMRIARKLPRERKQIKLATRTGFSVERIDDGPYHGIVLDGDHRYLLGDFTVTHNTVFATSLMAELQVPTLVVVHKEFLVDQWKTRIQQYLPDAQIGIAQGPNCDYKGKHVVIGMVHSLCDKDYGEEFRRWPGLVLTDECHRIGAGTWSAVPPMFTAAYRIGLSATPRRKDGADDVFKYHIGDIIFASKEVRMKPKVRRVWITPDIFKLVHTNSFNPNLIKKGMLLRFMCASTGRNRVITEQLILAVKAGRKCLIVSERLQHLRDLETALYKLWGTDSTKPSIGFYIGGQEQAALDEAAKAQVIFATSQLVQEGLDIPPLDTLFLVTPLGDIEQVCGRILRPHEGKKDPIVVDFREDHIPICKKYGEYRDKYYSKNA